MTSGEELVEIAAFPPRRRDSNEPPGGSPAALTGSTAATPPGLAEAALSPVVVPPSSRQREDDDEDDFAGAVTVVEEPQPSGANGNARGSPRVVSSPAGAQQQQQQQQQHAPSTTNWTPLLLFIVLVHIAAGVSYTVALAWQNRMVLSADGGNTRSKFAHPFIQSFFVLLGQAVNLPSALLLRSRQPPAPAPRKSHMMKISVILFCTSLTETVETTLSVIALTMMDSSVFSMTRLSQLIFAFAVQKFKPQLRRWLFSRSEEQQRQRASASAYATATSTELDDEEAATAAAPPAPATPMVMWRPSSFTNLQIGGLAAVCIGTFCVFLSTQDWSGLSNAVSSATSSTTGNGIGCGLVIAAMLLLSIQMALHEYVLTSFPDEISPMELIGVQGAGCVVWTLVVVLVVNAIGFHDDIQEFLRQLSSSPTAIVSVLLTTFSVGVVDGTGTVLTQQLTANVRPALQPLRSLCIWIFNLGTAQTRFNWMQAVGFVVAATGSLCFKEMITVPLLARFGAWLRSKFEKTTEAVTAAAGDAATVLSPRSSLAGPLSPVSPTTRRRPRTSLASVRR